MRALPPLLLGLVCAAAPVRAQVVTRDNYLELLPPMPALVSETRASASLRLYGDPTSLSYSDLAPRDGIDDARAARLLELAERFSPILRRNNFSVPRHFADVLGSPPLLHVDTWQDGRRVRSDTIALAPTHVALGFGAQDPTLADHDAALAALVQEFEPDRARPAVRSAEGEQEKVLFFDFPGEDPASWRKAYAKLPTGDSKIYAHFFLEEEPSASGPDRYRFVIQYWFFYPFNDAGNNHEGDWEHLNVHVALRRQAPDSAADRTLWSAEEIARVLEGAAAPLDSLAVGAVDYYFHESVMTVPYPDAAAAAAGAGSGQRTHAWEDPRFVARVVRRRMELAGGRLATHPIGYIGGNNKGPDELITLWPRFWGSYNRNSHGTYPLPGVWETVGPAGATEKIAGRVVPAVRARHGPASGDSSWQTLLDDDHYIAYAKDRIILLPDWERIQELVLSEREARRTWSWLILPMRWGFPTSRSPGAGLLEHYDVGNVAPEGPAFQPTWNRSATRGGFQRYTPRVLKGIQTNPWAGLQNGWGFLNIPLALWVLVPGANVVVSQLGPWSYGALDLVDKAPARTFYPRELPLRFSSVGGGWFYQLGGGSFAQLLPQEQHPQVAALLSDGRFVDPESFRLETRSGPRVLFNLYRGRRLSWEYGFGRDSSGIRYAIADSSGRRVATVAGTLQLNELTGGLRYSVGLFRG
ncbi:MAG: hypothetical protein HY561_05490, partial [Gemmatimonadetes bacterium]|nr:hypothetical protein [Gemmatimonadota bacterium]